MGPRLSNRLPPRPRPWKHGDRKRYLLAEPGSACIIRASIEAKVQGGALWLQSAAELTQTSCRSREREGEPTSYSLLSGDVEATLAWRRHDRQRQKEARCRPRWPGALPVAAVARPRAG